MDYEHQLIDLLIIKIQCLLALSLIYPLINFIYSKPNSKIAAFAVYTRLNMFKTS